MFSYRDLIQTFRALDLGAHSRVIVHASMDSFGPVAGGAETIAGALVSTCELVLAPSFTFSTMVTPSIGPADNAIEYGSGVEQNSTAVVFDPQMSTDSAMGVFAEKLRSHPKATRSNHPILSFTGVDADAALETQSVETPWAPIQWLADFDGDVLLLGVDHTHNISLHYAELKAGRRQFVRWALTRQGVVECPGFPGCAQGFQAIAPRLDGVARKTTLGEAVIEAIPVRDLVHIAIGWIREDPRALLCDQLGCERCAAVRASVRVP